MFTFRFSKLNNSYISFIIFLNKMLKWTRSRMQMKWSTHVLLIFFSIEVKDVSGGWAAVDWTHLYFIVRTGSSFKLISGSEFFFCHLWGAWNVMLTADFASDGCQLMKTAHSCNRSNLSAWHEVFSISLVSNDLVGGSVSHALFSVAVTRLFVVILIFIRFFRPQLFWGNSVKF